MTYLELLINTCTIRRWVDSGTDAYGSPIKSWGDIAIKPCRLVAGAGKEIKVGTEVVVSNHRLFLEDVDITERDRVAIGTETYEVVLVSDRQNGTGVHHKECDLIGVNS